MPTVSLEAHYDGKTIRLDERRRAVSRERDSLRFRRFWRSAKFQSITGSRNSRKTFGRFISCAGANRHRP